METIIVLFVTFSIASFVLMNSCSINEPTEEKNSSVKIVGATMTWGGKVSF